MCEVSTCKTVTDIRKMNGGGGHELRRNLSSFRGWKKSERVLLQCLQCQGEREKTSRTRNPSDSSLLVKHGTEELKNSREDR